MLDEKNKFVFLKMVAELIMIYHSDHKAIIATITLK